MIFRDIFDAMDLRPEEVLFIKDNINNIKRAQGKGLKIIHFTDIERFKKEIENCFNYGRTKTSP